MQLNECINFRLTNAQNTVFNYFKGRLSVLDITPVQYALLKCLWDSGDQSPSQLAQSLHLDASTVTGIVARMERKDLIERIHSSTDRRAVTIHIKPAGKALQPDIERIISDANSEVLELLNDEAYGQFMKSLDAIVEKVESLGK